MKQESWDERQLWIRGSIYKHIMLLLSFLVLLNALVEWLHGKWAPGMYPGFILLMLSVTAGSVEMICKDVYLVGRTMWSAIISVTGALCTLMVLFQLLELSAGQISLCQPGGLTTDGANMVLGGCMMVIFTAFLIRRLHERRHGGHTEEDGE